jgi:hypothetical protein
MQINPRHLYAADRRFAFDFDQDTGEEPGSITALDLAQGKKPKLVARPSVAPQPATAAPALPDIRPPARPRPVSRITEAYDTHAPLSRIGAEPEPKLRDYRGRQIEDSVDFARDQYVRRGGTTDEAGNFTPQKPGLMRRIGDAALNTFLALGQAHKADPNGGLGNLGAAIAAGVISGRDPVRARELRFNTLERPQVEAEENRQAQRQARFLGAMKNRLDLEKQQAEIDKSRADTERIRDLIRNPRQTRQPQLKLGRDRRTKDLRYFDPLDPAQAAQYEPYEFAQQRPRTPQLRLGRRISTGEIDYYDASDPDEAGVYEPYRMPSPSTEKAARPPLGQLSTDRTKLDDAKQTAQRLWQKWGETPEGPEKEKARQRAGVALDAYNRAVDRFGELYGEWYETGPGEGGWGYVKKRQGQAQGGGSSQPTAQRKATVDADFVRHVMQALGVSEEEARRRIEADGYTIRMR